MQFLYGASGGIRTPNTRLRRPMLYPVELRMHILKSQNEQPLFYHLFSTLAPNLCSIVSSLYSRVTRHHLSQTTSNSNMLYVYLMIFENWPSGHVLTTLCYVYFDLVEDHLKINITKRTRTESNRQPSAPQADALSN